MGQQHALGDRHARWFNSAESSPSSQSVGRNDADMSLSGIDLKVGRSTRRCFRPERSIGVSRTRTSGKGRAVVRGDNKAGYSGRIGSPADKRTPPWA